MPGPPTSLAASDLTSESVTLTWKSPKQDGGSPVTGYTVEKIDLDKGSWISVVRLSADDHRTTVKNLTKDHRHNFRVYAENKIGTSEAAELLEPVRPSSGIGNFFCIYPLNENKKF